MDTHAPFRELAEDPHLLDIYYGSYLRARSQVLNRPDRETRTLAYTQELWHRLGIDPARQFPCIAVAGSKGKGSTATLLASILSASGAIVGLVTSPHLLSFRERIRIQGRTITETQLMSALNHVAPAVQDITARITPPRYLGPGGIVLAMAMLLFAQADVTVCVIEAGRGGEFDEAHLVDAHTSILTRIMLEHTAYLGTTLAEIATTKARIAASGSGLVIAPQTPEVYPPVLRAAGDIPATPYVVEHELSIDRVVSQTPTLTCDLTLRGQSFPALAIGVPGLHQIANAATAIRAAQMVAAPSVVVTDAAIRKGLERVRVPGRLQMLSRRPWVVLDGAVTAISAETACAYFHKLPCRRRYAILAVPEDKDLAGVCRVVSRSVERLILTEVPSVRLKWHPQAQDIAAQYHAGVQIVCPADEAFDAVLNDMSEEDGLLILGTQTFVANALYYWGIDTERVW